MPSQKSRPINPAAAQRKLEKQRALRKSKAAIQAQRTTRLATRNPLRLEQTIASLESLQESQGGKLGPQEKKALEDAERDLVRVRKARETVGVKDGSLGRNEGGGGGGKGTGAGGQGLRVKRLRREMEGKSKAERESEEEEDNDEETDEDVRRIPMPRDSPPPIPRRPNPHPASTSAPASNANLEPLGPARLPPSSYTPDDITTTTTTAQSPASASASAPAPAVIKVYESAPQVRDLHKEAVASFVPEVVRRKLDAVRGKGKLLEEEELRELEKGGYTNVVGGGAATSATGGEMKKKDRGNEEEADKEELFRKEEERFEREVMMVASVEEVDEDEWMMKEKKKEKNGTGDRFD